MMSQLNLIIEVATVWELDGNHTVIDVVRTVRAESPRAPFLIFIDHFSDARPALEFSYVMATDAEFEVKEFVGIKHET